MAMMRWVSPSQSQRCVRNWRLSLLISAQVLFPFFFLPSFFFSPFFLDPAGKKTAEGVLDVNLKNYKDTLSLIQQRTSLLDTGYFLFPLNIPVLLLNVMPQLLDGILTLSGKTFGLKSRVSLVAGDVQTD